MNYVTYRQKTKSLNKDNIQEMMEKQSKWLLYLHILKSTKSEQGWFSRSMRITNGISNTHFPVLWNKLHVSGVDE